MGSIPPSLNGIVQHFPRVFKPRPPYLDSVCLGTVFAASALRGRGAPAAMFIHFSEMSDKGGGNFLMTAFKMLSTRIFIIKNSSQLIILISNWL